MKIKYLSPEIEIIEVASYNQILAGSETQQQWNVPGSGTNNTRTSEEDEGEGSRAPGFMGDF